MIQTTFWLQLASVTQIRDENAMAVFQAAAQIEAAQHNYRLVGEPQLTGGGDEPWLLVWNAVPTPA